jgi:hypothetical protein
LNAALLQAAERLREKHLGCAASVELDETATLWWKKHEGQWDLYLEDHKDSLHSIIKASRMYRVMAASRLAPNARASVPRASGRRASPPATGSAGRTTKQQPTTRGSLEPAHLLEVQ